jgi:hypothetical protein
VGKYHGTAGDPTSDRVREGDRLAITRTRLLAPLLNPRNILPARFNAFIDERNNEESPNLHRRKGMN